MNADRAEDGDSEVLRRVVDDILTGRDLHGLEARVARDLQLAASAITHDRFRKLIGALARLLRAEPAGGQGRDSAVHPEAPSVRD